MPPMQFFLIGCSAEVAKALVDLEHKIHEPAEVGLETDASAEQIFEAAVKRQWDIVTTVGSVAMAPFEGGVAFARSVVYLQEGGGIDRLFARYKRLSPGRLYTVTAGRVKVRQLPRKQVARD
jgi:hypothetical protein